MNTIWTSFPAPTPTEACQADTLLSEYQAKGHISRTVSEMLHLPGGVMTHFYRQLASQRSAESPVKRLPDSSWMVDADFCFINVRATGIGDKPGNFIQAAKMLPAIRTSAIHLGPFTDYDFNNIYAVRSVRTISPRVVDPQLLISDAEQLHAFVQAAHLLGKTVGFDIEPHTAQYAIPVILHPELFRWFRLSPDKTSLAGGATEDEMLAEPYQQCITGEIHAIVVQALASEEFDNLESAPGDSLQRQARKQQVYRKLIGTLITHGYWPIPSQSWAGRGVPAFGGYNFEGNYARFAYRGQNGEDLSETAYHILTPYKFYTGIFPNRAPDAPLLNQPAVNYFCDIFSYWRDEFDFDFMRYDSVDHIFDSLTTTGQPAADRPTPSILRSCIENSKAPGKPYIGNFAERMGNEIEAYAVLGYDVMLGNDMLQKVDAALVDKSFQIYNWLSSLNRNRPQPASIAFCIDTHDTGDPGLWGEPLVKACGPAQMRLRHFLSRFLSVGLARRPKYEVMGSQDLSYGLYQSNVSEANLTWVGDVSFNRRYHYLEDIYTLYRPALKHAEITHHHVEPSHAWWLITADQCWLVPIIAFTQTDSLALDLPAMPRKKLTATLYDFDQLSETTHPLSSPQIETPEMAAESARLFVIRQQAS